MDKLQELTQDIAELGHNYSPGPDTIKHLSSKTIVPIIGPTAIGKNTAIEALTTKNDVFSRSVGFTTRPQRASEPDDSYAFISHTTEELERIKLKLEQKKLVQVAVFPTTNMIYGSGTEDYSTPFVLIDYLASAMSDLPRLGFKNITPIALVAEIEDWKKWLDERLSDVGSEDYKKRMREAALSLAWVIENDDQVNFVFNKPDEQANVATSIEDICINQGQGNERGIELAKTMLVYAESVI